MSGALSGLTKKIELDGVKYEVLSSSDAISSYVIKICEEEWSVEDFDDYGDDLYEQTWRVQSVEVEDILPDHKLLQSSRFIADVTPRIATQRKLHKSGVSIPPLILRGKDNFIFDGYARWHLFRELGVEECLAYKSSV